MPEGAGMSKTEKFLLLWFILSAEAAHSLPPDARLVDHWPLVLVVLVSAGAFIIAPGKGE